MSTAAQNEANRANAQKSTGPRTPEGKARSSQNAATQLSDESRVRANHASLERRKRLLRDRAIEEEPLWRAAEPGDQGKYVIGLGIVSALEAPYGRRRDSGLS